MIDKIHMDDSNVQLKALVENSSTGIYIVNDHYQFEFVNDRVCELVGYTREELIGTSFVDYLGPSKELVVERYNARQSGLDVPSDYEIDIITKSGQVRYFHLSASSYQDAKGETKSIGHILDITDLKQANAELFKLRQALDQSPVMVMIMDAEAKIEYVNTAFLEYTGYEFNDLLGQHSDFMKSDLHSESFFQELIETITAGKIWRGELQNRKKDGSVHWLKASIGPIFNEKHKIVHFIALEEDITEYKREMAIAERNHQLRDLQYQVVKTAISAKDISELYEQVYVQLVNIIQSENILLALIDEEKQRIFFPFDRDTSAESMPDSIPFDPQKSLTAKTIADEQTIYLNTEQILELAGSGGFQLVGEIPSVWLGIPLKVEEKVIGAFVVQEYDGISQYPEADVKTLELAAGQIALAIDRTRKTEALQIVADELRQTNDIKELLLDVITHDLRNPAGVIKTLSDVLVTEREQDDLLKTIKTSSDSLLMVIENASVLSRINVGESIQKKKLNLRSMIDDVVIEFTPQIKNARMKVSVDVPDDLYVQANPILAEIPKNYLNNAIKYASQGKQVDIYTRLEHGDLVLYVDDMGTPIPEAKREVIFNRFKRAESGEIGGQGLGLAIVKRIADAHAAEVGVQESSGGGNSFFLKF